MDKKELQKERKKLIDTYKKEKDVLYKSFKSKLDALDKQIKGQQNAFANKQAKTVNQVMHESRKGKLTKPDTYKWNKAVQKKRKVEKK